jgi:hypothetical protein
MAKHHPSSGAKNLVEHINKLIERHLKKNRGQPFVSKNLAFKGLTGQIHLPLVEGLGCEFQSLKLTCNVALEGDLLEILKQQAQVACDKIVWLPGGQLRLIEIDKTQFIAQIRTATPAAKNGKLSFIELKIWAQGLSLEMIEKNLVSKEESSAKFQLSRDQLSCMLNLFEQILTGKF